MGGVKDKYLFYEAAGDHYVGRCATLLNRLDKEFAVSPPYFDFSSSKLDAVEKIRKHKEIEDFLYTRIQDLTDMERTKKMIMMAFASICYHRKFLDHHLSAKNPFRAKKIWTDLTEDMSGYARIAYPWDKTDDTPAFTGIPPHVTLLADMHF